MKGNALIKMYETGEAQRNGWPVRMGALMHVPVFHVGLDIFLCTEQDPEAGYPIKLGSSKTDSEINLSLYYPALDIIDMTIEKRGKNIYYVCAEGGEAKSVLYALDDFRLSSNATIIQKEGGV